MEEEFTLWEHGAPVEVASSEVVEEVICGLDNTDNLAYNTLEAEHIVPITDQAAAENLMFLSQDVNYTETALPDEEFVTEEVITDDWVVTDGQERVEVPLEQLDNFNNVNIKIENDIDIALPTDQDEYTAMRPWPCDFCSRRFRKKAALMNHMVAHQKDRPHSCNLCGVRYICKSDLMMHLKVHAYVPDHVYDEEEEQQFGKQKKKRGRRKKLPEPVQEDNSDSWENMTSARTQQWSRGQRRPSPPRVPTSPDSPRRSPDTPRRSPDSPPAPPVDPRRPFVCKHCGVGFAREKALQSHSRIHGGDSPLECSACGELCWSREALSAHTRSRHPNLPQAAPSHHYEDDNSDDDMDYHASPEHNDSGSDRVLLTPRDVKGPELYCQDCGVAFQRADLLRRHVTAAHSHKRRPHYSSSASVGEHTCDVCGETCTDALQLLAHAEGHARTPHRLKKSSRGRHNSSGLRQFPCKECGKVFASRSSQQIHVRIHTGERPYACRFCWKAFADGGTLRKHERIHTGEKPYACAVCPRAFNQRVVLREHVRSHHSAPNYHAANGVSLYECPVCDESLATSGDLVQHLIQHCDNNTAMKRKPQVGFRKYKRRKPRPKSESPPSSEWPDLSPSPPPSPAPPRPPPPPRRRGRARGTLHRPRMIHTERNSQVGRPRKPPRRPADDLLALRPPQSLTSPKSPQSPLSPRSPQSPSPIVYKCEMCSDTFRRSDDLLRHVAVHI